MSQAIITRISDLSRAVGVEIKNTRVQIGNLAQLQTTAKDSLVNSINELKAGQASITSKIDLPTAKRELIKDNAKAADTTYSSNKIEAMITAAKADVKSQILDDADAAYDTLKEIATYIEADKSGAASLTEGLNNRLRIDQAMELTPQQKGFVAQSIGLTDTDFVQIFNTALTS